jgi:hypothetical protein
MEYETVIRLLPGWEEIFQKYDIEWVIIPSDSMLAGTLTNEYQWEILYEDETAIVLRNK